MGIYSKYNILGGKQMETTRPRGTDNVKVIKVIQTKSLIGRGAPKDPARYVYQYWDFKGNLLASHDTLDNISD